MILYVMNVHRLEKNQEQGGGKQSPPGPSPGHALPQEGKDPSHCFGGNDDHQSHVLFQSYSLKSSYPKEHLKNSKHPFFV